jgi:hypothetical protein
MQGHGYNLPLLMTSCCSSIHVLQFEQLNLRRLPVTVGRIVRLIVASKHLIMHTSLLVAKPMQCECNSVVRGDEIEGPKM